MRYHIFKFRVNPIRNINVSNDPPDVFFFHVKFVYTTLSSEEVTIQYGFAGRSLKTGNS